eukprot:2624579-Prymnesium_polylepis.1
MNAGILATKLRLDSKGGAPHHRPPPPPPVPIATQSPRTHPSTGRGHGAVKPSLRRPRPRCAHALAAPTPLLYTPAPLSCTRHGPRA